MPNQILKPLGFRIINDIVQIFSKVHIEVLTDNIVSIYLNGSLGYGDFNYEASDIDIIVIIKTEINKNDIEKLQKFYDFISQSYSIWHSRIECSYILENILSSTYPPLKARLYFNNTKMHVALYGYEWLIDMYNLYNFGILLYGINIRELIDSPILMNDVIEAVKNDFFKEWVPLTINQTKLKDDHYQAYAILTMCRILYLNDKKLLVSKTIAANWVQSHYDKSLYNLIQLAKDWKYGQKIAKLDDLVNFIKFVGKIYFIK